MRHLAAFLLACATTVLTSACNDVTGTTTYDVVTDTLRLYALSGTPVQAPAGLSLLGSIGEPSVNPITVGGNFDLALDLVGTDRVRVFRINDVLSTASGIERAIEMRRATTSFESMGEAPSSNYVADSALTIAIGETLVVRAETDWCASASVNVTYAKLVVDSVDVGTRRLEVRVTVNPNCGERRLR